jgi:hypothetical protein
VMRWIALIGWWHQTTVSCVFETDLREEYSRGSVRVPVSSKSLLVPRLLPVKEGRYIGRR